MKRLSILSILLGKIGYVKKVTIASRVKDIKMRCVSLEKQNQILTVQNQVAYIKIDRADMKIKLLEQQLEQSKALLNDADKSLLETKAEAAEKLERTKDTARKTLAVFESSMRTFYDERKKC